MNLDLLVDKARQSTLFTAPVIGSDLERFLHEQGQSIRYIAHKALEQGIDHIFWVGSGNSWTNLYSGKYLLDQMTDIASDCFTSYEFLSRNPRRLGENALAFFASFSGATEDTVLALRHANKRGAHTVALVNDANSLMGQEAGEVVPYNSNALYIMPMAAAYLFSLEVARLQGNSNAQDVIDGLLSLSPLLSIQYIDEEFQARRYAEEFSKEKLFYVLGTGPLYGLAYKFGLTVFMENMRVHGSFIDTPEFRHGPVEMLERENPVMVVLKGTDKTREMVDRVAKSAQNNGARLLIYDLANYSGVHSLLAPFVLMIPLQWFAVYSALLRGITDLDDRVFMGRGILSQGAGVTWP
jgi:fructoselysine 6-phosphate deglycase